jgi:hypothetical protein
MRLTRLITLASLMSFSFWVQADSGLSKGIYEIATDDLNAEQRPWMDNLNAPRSQDFQVRAWLDRQASSGDIPVYYIGEEVVFYVETNQDAYLTIIDVGTSGRESVIIFPNKYRQNNRILANQPLRIPHEGSAEMFQVSGPPGRELIKIIATTQPLDFFNQPGLFTAFGPYKKLNSTSEVVSKDLNVVLRQSHANSVKEYNDTQIIIDVHPHSFGDKLNLATNKLYYSLGDKVNVRVTPDVDCHLTILNIGASGDRTIIFPNRFQTNNFVPQGHTLLLPGDNPHFRYIIKGIKGLEKLVGVCCAHTRPVYMDQYDFSQHTFQPVSKDLNVVERRNAANPIAHAQTVFWVGNH